MNDFVRRVEERTQRGELSVGAPVLTASVNALEHRLGAPLPFDLRLVLGHFNGGELPNGELLGVEESGGIDAELAALAQRVGTSPRDPEAPLPFFRTTEGSTLAFDRGAGPVSDTWPIIDYFPNQPRGRLVHRTFDGWCRYCVAEWESGDLGAAFTLDAYLRRGQRHATIEPDVSTAHATVAHARRRLGEPEHALTSYLAAARCVPALAWADWEALKLATLLGMVDEGLEAASRLLAPAPETRWAARETTATKVLDLAAMLARKSGNYTPWIHVVDHFLEQPLAKPIAARASLVRKAVATGMPPPEPIPAGEFKVDPKVGKDALFDHVKQSYVAGAVRDEDLLLNEAIAPLRKRADFLSILRLRRDFK